MLRLVTLFLYFPTGFEIFQRSLLQYYIAGTKYHYAILAAPYLAVRAMDANWAGIDVVNTD